MSFLKYSDIPVYANFISENTSPVVTNSPNTNHMFAATQVSLTLAPNLSPNRYLGKSQIRNDFSVNGPLEGKLSLTFFPLIEYGTPSVLNIQRDNQLSFFNTTGNFNLGHQIRMSNYLLKQSYLQNYSIKINPFQPISITANFISYDVSSMVGTTLTSSTSTSIAVSPTTPYYEGLHGLSTNMDAGTSNNIPNTKTSIDINVDCQRTPIYTLGSKTPNQVVLTALERTTTINGDNIGNAVDISGANAGATNIYMLPLSKMGLNASLSNNIIYFDINGRITSQDVSVSQQGILNGKVVIKEIIL
jgi:hypothetical protein